MKKLNGMRSVLIALGLCAVTTSALAADGKNLSGSMCVKWSGTTPSYSWGMIQNPSTSTTMFIDCPAVKDAGDISSGVVVAKDRHNTLAVNCTLESVYGDDDGTIHHWFWNGAGTPGANERWHEIAYSGLNAASRGVYFYSCTIPPFETGDPGPSGVLMYNVVEN